MLFLSSLHQSLFVAFVVLFVWLFVCLFCWCVLFSRWCRQLGRLCFLAALGWVGPVQAGQLFLIKYSLARCPAQILPNM